MYLDELPILQHTVGHGELGLHGNLGYEGHRVMVLGQPFRHAISAHPPSHLVFELAGRFAEFGCRVALNDDVATRGAHADFVLLADDHVAAVLPFVRSGERPRELAVSVRNTARLTLIVQTRHWECCHAVWLDPQVWEAARPAQTTSWTDSLRRVEAERPARSLQAGRCIATVVSPGYTHLLDDMLGSLAANGRCPEALVVVFVVDGDDACMEVIEKYRATVIACRATGPKNPTIKAVLYSVASVVDAQQFLCLDADTLILGDLRPLFAALDAYPPDSILICRDAYLEQGNLQRQLCTHYRGRAEDFRLLLGTPDGESSYPLAINDGVFAGSRRALLRVEGLLRNMPGAVAWLDQYPDHGWRNQFLFNLALARLRCGVEIDSTYNLQLHVHDVQLRRHNGGLEAWWRGREARILHFCGWGRDKYPEYRGIFAAGAPA